MNKDLTFDVSEYGIKTSSPIEYNVFRTNEGWCARVINHLLNEEGEIDLNGNCCGSFLISTDPNYSGFMFKSEQEAKNACQKHFSRFLEEHLVE